MSWHQGHCLTLEPSSKIHPQPLVWHLQPGSWTPPASSLEPGSLTWEFAQEITLSPPILPRNPHERPGLTHCSPSPPLVSGPPCLSESLGSLCQDPCWNPLTLPLSCTASDSVGSTLYGENSLSLACCNPKHLRIQDLAVWLREIHLTSTSLSFLIYKMGMIFPTYLAGLVRA